MPGLSEQLEAIRLPETRERSVRLDRAWREFTRALDEVMEAVFVEADQERAAHERLADYLEGWADELRRAVHV